MNQQSIYTKNHSILYVKQEMRHLESLIAQRPYDAELNQELLRKGWELEKLQKKEEPKD